MRFGSIHIHIFALFLFIYQDLGYMSKEIAIEECVGLWGEYFLISGKMAFIAGSVMTLMSALLLVGSSGASFEVIVSVCD